MHRFAFKLIFPLLVAKIEVATEVTIKPQEGCVCPDRGYSCRADSVTEIEWDSRFLGSKISYDIHREKKDADVRSGGLRVLFSEVLVEGGLANLTAQLFLVDQHTWNRSNATCQAIGQGRVRQATATVCVTGPASPPTVLSVVWDSPSAVVSFQSPVYGGECVNYYVVTAASEERNVLCNVTSDGTETNCSIYLGDDNVNDFNFTVHGVTRVNDILVYNGSIATGCCLPFPENIRATEVECRMIRMSWENKRNTLEIVNTTISWRGVHVSGVRHYERGSSEDSHLLTVDYSETGPVEIAVTLSSSVCNKTTVTHYHVEGVLTSVYLRSKTLVIESRDCIARPENYRIRVCFVDTPTPPLVLAFSTTVEYDLGGYVTSSKIIRVELVEKTSNTTIDEKDATILLTVPTITATEPGATVAATDSMNVYTTVGVAVGGVIFGVAMTVVVLVIVRNMKKHFRDTRDSTVGQTVTDAVKCFCCALHKEAHVVCESRPPAVVYETVSDVVTPTGPDTSENVAYGVSHSLPTTTQHNPAYGVAGK